MSVVDKRFDLHLTSSGRALEYRPACYFPASDFKTTLNNPLPPRLAKQDEIIKFHQTTTGEAHDYKHHDPLMGNSPHQKAPGHWKVLHNKDLREKTRNRPWRQELTMGNQKSEVQANFKGDQLQPGVDYHSIMKPQTTNLIDHHISMPPHVKDHQPKYSPSQVRDDGVLQILDPYVPTSLQVHKRFTLHELGGYPKKDVATYWRCEDYPQTMGHGTKHNPLPPHSVPRQRPPMTDETVFTTSIKQPIRIPDKFTPMPHNAMQTTAGISYVAPSDQKTRENFICPVDPPWVIPPAGPEQAFPVPAMYTTEYQNYASGKTLTT